MPLVSMDFNAERARLVRYLRSEIKDKRVLDAMSRIPRELFVPSESQFAAYDDNPLPIGFNQTISQPYIIALMTEALELKGDEKVLEIGTGSGYQAAILGELARSVVTIERVPELIESAQKILCILGLHNIRIFPSEETLGWQQDAPYDAIMVTAGAPGVPNELLAQLAPGGKMVIPVGSRFVQELCRITKSRDKNIIHNMGACRFVPLIGKGAWEKD